MGAPDGIIRYQDQNLKPKAKAYKESDEKGLYLLVSPSGSKLWKLKYRYDGKEKKLSFGPYPEVKLAEARRKRDDAKRLLADDIDPSLLKKERKLARLMGAENSFEIVALEWHAKNVNTWTPDHGKRILARLKKDIFPWIGKRPISEIKAPELLKVLERIQNRGAIETAHRALQNCGQIFRYAVITGRAEYDVSTNLRGALQPVKKRNHASITEPSEISHLLRAMDDYVGYFATKCALKLSALFFVRPGELRQAEWSEFNFDTKEWRIPAHKMKMRVQHIVPLSHQAITLLNELKTLTGHTKYVFPSVQTPQRPMSNNTINTALRRLGYTKDQMTAHGFRSMACTLLNEQGWHRDAIERQLAHSERNSVRAAYNYAEYLSERKEMMQAWADYLDELRESSVIPEISSTVSEAI